MKLNNKINIHNRFDIEIRDSITGELKKSFTSFNIVLNQMYTRLCGGSSYFVNIHFGSGVGSLAATRTNLFTHLGTKIAVDEEIIKAIPLSTWKRKIVLNPEEYVGSTISEVGIAYEATNTNLVTHSLLKDSEGNPISIVKTDVDIITIYATVFVTLDNSNLNLIYLSMPSSNTLINYLIGGGTAPTGAFSLNDLYSGVDKLGSTTNVTWTSDVPNKQRKTSVQRFATTDGNGQVKFLEFANVFSLELPYAPVFNGQSYIGVSLGVGDGVKTTFEIPSAFIKDLSLVVKKNGVVDNGISVVNYLGGLRTGAIFNSNASKLKITKNGLHLIMGNTFDSLRVYDLVGGVWVVRPTVVSGTTSILCLEISDDGSVIVIVDTGVLLTYKWYGTSWTQLSTPPSIPQLANTKQVALSQDGKVLAVPTYGSPYGNVYDYVGSAWVKRPTPVCNYYGMCADLTPDGNTVAFGNSDGNNALFVSDWNGTSWTARTNPPINTGSQASMVAISSDGLRVGVATYGSPYITVFDWNGTSWVICNGISGFLTVQGQSIVFSSDKNTIYFNSTSGAKIFAFDWNGSTFIQRTTYTMISPNIGGLCLSPVSNELFYSVGTVIRSTKGIKIARVIFNTPPSIGDVITADYIVDGVHKTNQFVIDASFAIQFGEGI